MNDLELFGVWNIAILACFGWRVIQNINDLGKYATHLTNYLQVIK